MYYTTVSGWMLNYFCKFSLGDFAMTSTGDVGNIFTSMLGSPTQMLLGMTASVVFGFLINSFGVQKGLELVSKVMMVGLFILILALAVHSLCLPNAI